MKIFSGLSLALLSSVLLSAQTAAPVSNVAEKKDETVQLSPFEVIADSGSGYATTSSVSVSRIATRNTEVPISALTINQQMIADTLAATAEDTFNLISGLHLSNAGTGNQENNTYSLRGYTGSTAQRDGVDDSLFTNSGGFDYSLVESIEVMKGPNGILYGSQASPGGVINIVSKRPRAKAFTKLSGMVGSFNYYRAELDTSQFFDRQKRFGFRLSGAVSDNDGPVDWAGDPKKGFRGVNGSMNYRSKDGFEVWLWAATVRDSSSRVKFMTRAFATSAPVTASVPGVTGAPLFDRDFIAGGAGQNLITPYTQVNTDTYEIGSSKSFVFSRGRVDTRVIGRYRTQFSDGSRVRGIGSDIFTNDAGVVVGSAPDNRFVQLALVNDGQIGGVYRTGLRYDHRPQDRSDHSYGIDINGTLNFGPIQSQSLFTGTFTSGQALVYNSTYDVTTAPLLQSLGYPIVNNQPRVQLYPADRVVFGVPREVIIERNNVRSIAGTTDTDSEVYGYGLLQRFFMFNRRFVVMGGARQSSTKSEIATTNAAGVFGAPVLREGHRTTPGLAGLFKFMQGEKGEGVVFANFNQTFIPVFTTDQRLATFGQKFPDRAAKTKEYGVKLDLLNSRIVATGSVFDNEETNVLRPQIDTTGEITGVIDRTYQAPVGNRKTKGFEIDVNFKVFAGLEAVLSYSEQEARLDSGLQPEAIPDGTASALLTYRFRHGILKGFSSTYIYNQWGDFFLGGGRTNWLISGGELHSLALGYRWRNTDIRVRITNLRDVRDAQPSSFDTGVGITTPRSVRVGLTQMF